MASGSREKVGVVSTTVACKAPQIALPDLVRLQHLPRQPTFQEERHLVVEAVTGMDLRTTRVYCTGIRLAITAASLA